MINLVKDGRENMAKYTVKQIFILCILTVSHVVVSTFVKIWLWFWCLLHRKNYHDYKRYVNYEEPEDPDVENIKPVNFRAETFQDDEDYEEET